MADNSYKLEFTLSNGRIINAGTIVAPQGEAGKNGVTFMPSVSEAGVLSWTNDGGLANPDPVNIKGDAAVITESDVASWGFTKNAGTITEIKMNGSSKGTSGVVDLGTVLTEHQSLENYVTLDGIQNITGKKTVIPPANKDNSNQIATTAWAGRRYKSIADFGFTSQTTVKAIVQKIIDNWYEYCTFACTNDDFNNFSDTPDGWGTLIIEVGSNALRPFISFTKQIGDSNSYKHWQANIVRGANNQVSEIQWYEIINSNLPQTISGVKTFEQNIIRKSNDIDISVASTTNVQYAFIDFNDKNGERIAAIGSRHDKDKYSGAYLQAKNVASMGIVVDDKNNVKTFAPTPSDGDNSTKIATTGWVLRNYNNADICYRGVDANSKYEGYYKVAEATLPNWYRISSARVFVQDFDSPDNGVLNVNVYAGGKTVDGVLTATTQTQVGFLDGTNCMGIKGHFFVVVRKQSTTERKPIKVELWYRQTGSYQRISATFLNDIGDSRGGITASNKWVKFTRTGAQEQSYFNKNVVDLVNGFVPEGKFTTTDIALDGYPITEIYDDSTNNAQFVAGSIRVANSQYARSDTPTTSSKREIIFTDKNNASIANIQSSVGSTWNGLNFNLTNKSGGGNSIEFVHDNTRSVWRFNPASESLPVELGEPNRPWTNGYITNLQLCKVINGGGGNSLIQQNSDTAGADIIVGSTNCALKIIGKYGRPKYRQGKNGTYVNLALHSDINNGTLTILKNGGSLGSFSANQSSDVDIDIDVPENLSELTNDIKVLRNNTDKSHSLSIAGTNDLDSAATDTYCIAIGPAAMARYTKTIKIGTGLTPNNQSVTQIGTTSYTSSGRALYLGAGNTGFTYMNSAGSSWTSASDIRDKTDIQTIDHALDFIKKLKPITYVMNDRERYLIRDKDDNPILDENGKQQYDVEAHKRGDKKKHRRFAGLSAQDTYQAMLDCYNNDTNYAQIVDNNKFDHPDDEYLEQYSMSYERLVPFLIKAVQEQQAQIDALKIKIAS